MRCAVIKQELLCVMGCVWLLGCEAPAGPVEAPTSGQAQQAVIAAPAAPAAPEVAKEPVRASEADVRGWIKQLAPGEEVLALLPDGALLSMPHEAPEFADQAKLLDVRMVGARVMRVAPEIPLEDVAAVAEGGLIAITVDRDLVALDARGGVARTIEGPVQGPLSVSTDGRMVAYMRGEVPDLAPVVLDVATGATQVLPTQGLAWSVALTQDGRAASFVEGGEQGPKLVRVGLDGEGREVLDAGGHFPVGSRAPVWLGDSLIFEAEAGLMRWSPRGVRPLRGSMPVRVPGVWDRVLVHHEGGEPGLITIAGEE
jgi:hypothetical protein